MGQIWRVWPVRVGLVSAAVALLTLLAMPLPGWSQSAQSDGVRVAAAKFTDQKIALDGQMSEPAWQTAAPLVGFTQREPAEGQPSTQRTEIRILYDQENLYIGAYCHDTAPDKIVINDIRRDFDSGEQDYFGVILDTFDDDRNGYYLVTTPVGGHRDLQFFNEGRESNVSWDGVWYAEAHRLEDGYSVEIAIPFKTLRFSEKPVQVWGAQFFRRIRRGNEGTYWAPIPRRYTVTRAVAFAGELQGIENVEPGRNLKVKPYVLAGAKNFSSRDKDTEEEFDGGVDVKYGITSGLILDLTLNTDFSHVEADTQQVNLTRFPLFFQEKREFFLENSGIFQFGALQRNEALLFHSRTIGLENNEPVPILGGARLTGRAGRNYLGLLNMQTRSEGSVPATNFTAARLRRDIFGNSDVGMILLNRQSRQPDDYNRSFGADANFLFFQTDLRLNALVAKTITPGRVGDERLGKVEGEYQNNLVRFLSSYVDIGKNFNPEMGFVRRRGRRIARQEFDLKLRFQPGSALGSTVRDALLRLTSERVFLATGRTETKLLQPQLNIEFQDGSTFQAQFTQNFERLLQKFDLPFAVEVPAGDYRFDRFNISYSSDRSKTFSGSLGYNRGDFYSGAATEWSLGARFRPNYQLAASVEYTRNAVELPQGAFHTDLVGVRLDYNFNPKMFLNSLVQYNNETGLVSSNIRYRLIHRPLSDIYLVYNEARDRRQDKTDWSFTVKYTHLLNF